MANEIIIRFGLSAIDKARAAVKDILRNAKEAAKSIQDPAFRRAFLAQARETAKARQEQLDRTARFDALGRQARDSRSATLGQLQPVIDRAAANAVTKALGVASRLGQLGGGVVSVLNAKSDQNGSKGLQLGLHALSASGIPIASQVAAVMSQVVSYMDARDEKLRARLDKEFSERIQQKLAEADVSRRYQEDVQYRMSLQRDAQAQYLGAVQGGWEPRGSRLQSGGF